MAVIEYRDTYLIDGFDLESYATWIETAEGLQDGPEVVGDLVDIPAADGAYDPYGGPDQPRPFDGVGRIRIDLGLQGVDPVSGKFLPGADTAARYWATVDDLMRRVYRRRVLITHPRPDGDRVAVARLAPGSSVAPSREPSSPWFGRARLEFVIPGGHWTSVAPVTTGVVSLPSGSSLDLGVFARATAPCTELLVRFYSAANPQLASEYARLKWAAVIPAGLQVQLDTATGLVSRGVGPPWATTDGQPGYAPLDYAPGPRLFEVDPAEPLNAVFTHTGGGSAGVEVTGRLRFRTS